MTERRPLAIIGGRQQEFPQGDTLPSDMLPDTAEFARWTPTLIADGQTFLVPENAQLITVAPVQVDGLVIVDGVIVQADPEAACTISGGGSGGGGGGGGDPVGPVTECVVPNSCYGLASGWRIVGTAHDGVFSITGDTPNPPTAQQLNAASNALSDKHDTTYIQAEYWPLNPGLGNTWLATVGLNFADFAADKVVDSLTITVRCFISANSSPETMSPYIEMQPAGIPGVPTFVPGGPGNLQHILMTDKKGQIVDVVFGPYINGTSQPWTGASFNNLAMQFQIGDQLASLSAPDEDKPKIYGVTVCATYADTSDTSNVEYVVPKSPLLGYEGEVLGAPNTVTGAATAMADGTDTSYIFGAEEIGANIAGFSALDDDANVGVKVFYVVARAFCASDGVVKVNLIDGIAPTPVQASANYVASRGTQNVLVGPFSAGASSWTPAQFNTLSLQVTFNTGDGADKYLYGVTVRATLATS